MRERKFMEKNGLLHRCGLAAGALVLCAGAAASQPARPDSVPASPAPPPSAPTQAPTPLPPAAEPAPSNLLRPSVPSVSGVPPVLRVEVEGNVKVPKETVLQWFAVRPGDPFDPRRLARAVEELTKKGRFAVVRVEGEEAEGGVILYVTVQEFPRLSQVRFEGLDALKESDLRAAVSLSAGSFVAPWQRQRDRDKILETYRDKGYQSAGVRDTLLAAEGGDWSLVWQVQEGQKASIRQIVFAGNERVPAEKLRKQMQTSTNGLWSGGDLKPEALKQDFDKIAAYYHSLGYLDGRVLSHDTELAANGKDLTLRIRIEEGKQYRVGKVEWKGNTVFADNEIHRVVRLFPGAPFDQSAFEATTQALFGLYQDRGYFYFTAAPRKDIQGDLVNVTYDISEGQQARLHHIRVLGNTKTQDKVVLREFSLVPGETFDRSLLQRSMRDVFQLGFFEDINIPPEGLRPREDGSVDLEVKVVEKQTGQLGAGAGYSAVNALTGFFEMAETNLFGTGKRVSFRWEFSRVRNDINFSYTQPWLFDSPMTLTVDLFNSAGRTRVNSFYRTQRTGGALRLGRRLDLLDFTTVSWRYRAENVTFTDIDPAVDLRTRLSLQDGRRRSTGLTLRRNSTDSPFFPTRGSEAEWNGDLFGTFLGGDVSFLHNEVELAWYQRLGLSKFTLALRSRIGVLTGLENKAVPNDELFRPGGVFIYPVRGYDEFEIYPLGNEPFVGGQALVLWSSELRYPFSPRVHGALFFDAGNTWNSMAEADFSDLRKGAGAGIRVEVPMIGLLGLDYAYGFDRVTTSGRRVPSWNFHFRFGNFF